MAGVAAVLLDGAAVALAVGALAVVGAAVTTVNGSAFVAAGGSAVEGGPREESSRAPSDARERACYPLATRPASMAQLSIVTNCF